MTKAVRKQNEKISDFCFRISALGRRFKLSEAAIIRYAREGLKHRELQMAIAVMKFGSMKNMREVCENFLQNRVKSVDNRTRDDNVDFEKIINIDNPVKSDKKLIVCFNCAENGHLSRNCPKPQKRNRCSDCNRVHAKNEPQNCGKPTAFSRAVKVKYRQFDNEVTIGGKPAKAIDINNSDVMLEKEKCTTNVERAIHANEKIIFKDQRGETKNVLTVRENDIQNEDLSINETESANVNSTELLTVNENKILIERENELSINENKYSTENDNELITIKENNRLDENENELLAINENKRLNDKKNELITINEISIKNENKLITINAKEIAEKDNNFLPKKRHKNRHKRNEREFSEKSQWHRRNK